MRHAPALYLKYVRKEIPPKFNPLGDTLRRILPRSLPMSRAYGPGGPVRGHQRHQQHQRQFVAPPPPMSPIGQIGQTTVQTAEIKSHAIAIVG
jgi:hypothetical protein